NRGVAGAAKRRAANVRSSHGREASRQKPASSPEESCVSHSAPRVPHACPIDGGAAVALLRAVCRKVKALASLKRPSPPATAKLGCAELRRWFAIGPSGWAAQIPAKWTPDRRQGYAPAI